MSRDFVDKADKEADKIIIAHRGASAYLPEHSLEAKALAYAQGAHYLEQDVAMSRDDALIVIHDHFLDRVTDVADKFPGRCRADGRWYVMDFTLQELRTLRFSEGFVSHDGHPVPLFPGRFPPFASHFQLHTLEEEIEFIQGLNRTCGREAGLYVETKAPWLHKLAGKDISKAVLKTLRRYGYGSRESKCYFQTFDFFDLEYVKKELMPALGMDLKSVLLLTDSLDETKELRGGQQIPFDWRTLLNEQDLCRIRQLADGVGPDYHLLFDQKRSEPGKIELTDLPAIFAEHGLIMHPYTVRKDQLPPYAGDINELFAAILCQAGAEGLFTDFPDLGVNFVKTLQA